MFVSTTALLVINVQESFPTPPTSGAILLQGQTGAEVRQTQLACDHGANYGPSVLR
jgi:hypothetical protein